jgi:hypothetical protein
MADKDDRDADFARCRLLELFKSDDWQFSERARREGRPALRWLENREPTDTEMVDYIVSLLESDTILRCAPQGDPPGSTGIAWQMTDARNIFVKIQICEIRMGQEYAFIQSIHESVHPQ